MRDVNEKDWKLFRSKLPDWQEAYMGKLVEEYKALLSGAENASVKYWALEERIRQDKRSLSVVLHDVSRSNMEMHLLQLLRYKVIQPQDLESFSEEQRERLAWIMGNV